LSEPDSIEGNTGVESSSSRQLSRVASGAAVSFVGKLVGVLVKYITQVAIALFLGAHAFGVYALGIAVYQFGELFAALGLTSGVVRYAAVYRGSADRARLAGLLRLATGVPFIGGVIVGSAIFILADVLARRVFHEPSVAPVLRILAVALPFGAAMMVGALATTALQTARYLVYIRDVLHPLANLLVVVVLCALGFGVVGAAGAWLAAGVLGLIAAVLVVRWMFPVMTDRSVVPIYETSSLLKFSLPLALSEFSWLLMLWTDVLMLGYYRSSADVGVYRAVSQSALFVPIFLGSVNTIFAPMIADLYHRSEIDRMGTIFQTATRWSLLLSAPVYVLFVVQAEEILRIFGPEFAVGALPLIVLGGGQLVNAASGGVGYMLVMSEHQYLKLVGDALFAVFNVALNALLIPRFGLIGAATATGISIAGLNVLRALQVRHLLGVHAYNRRYLKIGVGFAIALAAGLATRAGLSETHFLISLAAVGAVICGSYMFVLWLLRFEEEDRTVFNRLKARLLAR